MTERIWGGCVPDTIQRKVNKPFEYETLQQRVCSSPTEHKLSKQANKKEKVAQSQVKIKRKNSTIVAFGTQYAGRRKLFVQRETRGREKRDIKFKAGEENASEFLNKSQDC
jgi:hypothetical protein